jgi:1-acyl-sn-glycerol-3-phosphate acyltransferase
MKTQPISAILRQPLPEQPKALTRLLCRLLTAFGRRQLLSLRGLEHVAPERDPFVLAVNHNQRFEAVLLPALLAFERRGRLVHFLADWPMFLVPLVGLLYRRGGVIAVAGKSARPAFLNVFRPLFVDAAPAHEQGVAALRRGRSIGVFAEGTINRDPRRLLRGRPGAARMAIEAGVPVVPAGISFPEHRGEGPIRDGEPMAVEIGPPLQPPPDAPAADFHRQIFEQVAALCGKSFSPDAPRRKTCPKS